MCFYGCWSSFLKFRSFPWQVCSGFFSSTCSGFSFIQLCSNYFDFILMSFLVPICDRFSSSTQSGLVSHFQHVRKVFVLFLMCFYFYERFHSILCPGLLSSFLSFSYLFGNGFLLSKCQDEPEQNAFSRFASADESDLVQISVLYTFDNFVQVKAIATTFVRFPLFFQHILGFTFLSNFTNSITSGSFLSRSLSWLSAIGCLHLFVPDTSPIEQ